jgi:hypothetical protein
LRTTLISCWISHGFLFHIDTLEKRPPVKVQLHWKSSWCFLILDLSFKFFSDLNVNGLYLWMEHFGIPLNRPVIALPNGLIIHLPHSIRGSYFQFSDWPTAIVPALPTFTSDATREQTFWLLLW